MTTLDAPVRALIFDMDGLLVDSEDLAAAALRGFLAERGHEMHDGTMERTLGRRLPEAIAIVAEAYGLEEDLPALVDRYDALRLDALRGNVRQMPGARELIDWARAAGLPMALASSSLRTHVELSLREARLAGSFDAEVCGDEVERGKPAPDMFLLAAERIGAAPEESVVLEDAPAGLAAAHAAGMRGLWVPNEKTRGLEPGVPVAARFESLFGARDWIAARVG